MCRDLAGGGGAPRDGEGKDTESAQDGWPDGQRRKQRRVPESSKQPRTNKYPVSSNHLDCPLARSRFLVAPIPRIPQPASQPRLRQRLPHPRPRPPRPLPLPSTMPSARTKKEPNSPTPPSDDASPKDPSENSKIKRKSVLFFPRFPRSPSAVPLSSLSCLSLLPFLPRTLPQTAPSSPHVLSSHVVCFSPFFLSLKLTRRPHAILQAAITE